MPASLSHSVTRELRASLAYEYSDSPLRLDKPSSGINDSTTGSIIYQFNYEFEVGSTRFCPGSFRLACFAFHVCRLIAILDPTVDRGVSSYRVRDYQWRTETRKQPRWLREKSARVASASRERPTRSRKRARIRSDETEKTWEQTDDLLAGNEHVGCRIRCRLSSCTAHPSLGRAISRVGRINYGTKRTLTETPGRTPGVGDI
jgi:hypothetical protein